MAAYQLETEVLIATEGPEAIVVLGETQAWEETEVLAETGALPILLATVAHEVVGVSTTAIILTVVITARREGMDANSKAQAESRPK